MNKFIVCIVILASFFTKEVFAQSRPTVSSTTTAQRGKTENVTASDGQASPHIMWKKTYWRRIDMREKMNKPFFSKDKEITRWIIDAVRSHRLIPYTDDKLLTAMTVEEFNKNLKVPNQTRQSQLSESEKAMGFTEEAIEKQEDDWGDWGDSPTPKKRTETDTPRSSTSENERGETPENTAGADEFFPNEISVLELKEDVFFDRKAAKLTFDIQSLSLVIPAERFESGIDRQVASFKYADVMKALEQYPDAIWFNVRNNAQHRKISEAFALRLFNSRIVKVSNPDDLYLDAIYGNDEAALRAAQEEEYKLVEFENGLWEY